MARRGAGEGSIRRRPDGGWEARYYGRDREGRRQRVSVYGTTRNEVQDRLRDALQDRDRGLPAPGRTPTVEVFLVQWLASVKPSLRPKTYVSYEGTVRLHIVPRLGRVQLRRLTPSMIQGLLTAKLDTGQSPQSVRYVLKVLRIALGQAQRWDLVSRNVGTLVDGPRVPHRTVRVLSPDECRRFLESIEGTRQEALFTVALAVGLRRGELLGLKWADIDLDARRLVVGAALQRVTGSGPQLVETKTARGRRVVTLPRICVGALRAHRVRQVQDKLLAGAGWRETGFVFTNRNGGPLDGDRVSEQFKKALDNAGLPEVRFHDLRHGAASLLLMQGVPSRVVMDVLGHSQIAVTLNTYTHVMPSLVDEAAEAMDRALGSRSSS